jgi:hypothetical protein
MIVPPRRIDDLQNVRIVAPARILNNQHQEQNLNYSVWEKFEDRDFRP